MTRRILLWVAIFAVGATFGWFARSDRVETHRPLPSVAIHTMHYGRIPIGGGWFVETGVSVEPGARETALEVEVFAYPHPGRIRSASRVMSLAGPTRVELPDPVRAEAGKWWHHSGWTPGPAWVQVVAVEDGRRTPLCEPRKFELVTGEGEAGAYAHDGPTR